MNKFIKYAVYIYAALLTAAALVAAWALYSEYYYLLSSEQVAHIFVMLKQFYFAAQYCKGT